MCRLQTFPDSLVFDCGRTETQKMLGNAVPSLLAEVLARSIRRQLLGDELNLGALRLMPHMRVPAPDPEPVASVPSHYLELIGDHSDHPGEGRLSGRRKKGSPQDDHMSLIPAPAK